MLARNYRMPVSSRNKAWRFLLGSGVVGLACLWLGTGPARAQSASPNQVTNGTDGGKQTTAKPTSKLDSLLEEAQKAADAGQWSRALNLYGQARQEARANGDKAAEGNALAGSGRVYRSSGQPEPALQYYRLAYDIFTAMGDAIASGETMGNIGVVYADRGQSTDALKCYALAQQAYRAASHPAGEAAMLANIGVIYANRGQTKQALGNYRDAQNRYRALNDTAGEARMLDNIGRIYADTGQASQALESYEKARSLYQASKNREGEARILTSIGVIRAGDNPAEATKYFEMALPITESGVDPTVRARTLAALARVYADSGQWKDALANYQAAQIIYHAIGSPGDEARILGGMSRVYARQDRLADAEASYRQAIGLIEAQRRGLGRLTDAKIALQETYHAMYARYVDLLLRRGADAEAFGVVQQMKARALLDLLLNGKADLLPSLSADERRELTDCRAVPDQLNRAMLAEGARNEVGGKLRFEALQQQLEEAERKLAALTDRLYVLHPDLAQARSVETADVGQAAKLLPPGSALVEYAMLRAGVGREALDRAVAFVVTSDGKITRHDVGAASELEKLAPMFRGVCADPHTPYAPLAHELYARLLAPLEARVGDRRQLLICPDGLLWEVPFAALMDSQNQFVGERQILTFAGSATAARIALNTPRRPAAINAVLALANPDFGTVARFGDNPLVPGQRPFDRPSRPFDRPSRPFDRPSRDIGSLMQERGGFSPLPGTQTEADLLRGLYPNSAVYTGAAAQEATFKREAGKYRYLHLASHAFFNDASPLLSCVFLAVPPPSDAAGSEDGFLTARELFEMKLNADLVTLSACQTGRGELHSGEGMIGLTWALNVAGCPAQLVSQWSVDDEATATLMRQFYRELKAGQSKGKALQSAAAIVRDQEEMLRHPYYWAAFVLLGDWR